MYWGGFRIWGGYNHCSGSLKKDLGLQPPEAIWFIIDEKHKNDIPNTRFRIDINIIGNGIIIVAGLSIRGLEMWLFCS